MSMNKLRGRRGLLYAIAAFLLLTMLPVSASAAGSAGAAVNIPVYKEVVGDTPAANETFTFTLRAVDGAPMPGDSSDGVKSVVISGSGNALFGQIFYTEIGDYFYTITETDIGKQRYSCDGTVYSAHVQVSWKNKVGGELAATLYLAKEDGVYKQEKALFTNSYKMPVPVSADPIVHKTVSGSPDKDSTFHFRLTANNADYPMPSGSLKSVKSFSVTGSGTAMAGKITFTEPGVYSYNVSEVNNGIPGYTYDTTVYTMTVNVTEAGGKLDQSTTYTSGGGTKVSGMNFTNRYSKTSVTTKTVGTSTPRTGDTTNLTLLIATALISLAIAIAILIVILIKKRDDNDTD